MFLFLLAFMGAAVFEKYDDWNDVPPLAVDNIAMKTTLLSVFVYFTIVIIHENISTHIRGYITITNNIRFLSGTLAIASMFLILIQSFGWLLLTIWTMLLVKVIINLHEPFHNFDRLFHNFDRLIQLVKQYTNQYLPH